MKAKRAEVERLLQSPATELRLFLFHGPDIAGSNELAARAVAGADRVALNSADLKRDPALLADEAAAFSLFGERRAILLEGGGDEMLAAIKGLLQAPAAGNRVVVVTSALKKGARLLALAEASPLALVCVSYVPEGREAHRMVVDLGLTLGLRIGPDIARGIAEASGGDRAIIRNELVKFALYLDAAPERPATLGEEVVAALAAGTEEGDVSRIADAVLGSDLQMLEQEIGQTAGGSEVPVLRSLARRALVLARYRSEVERGSSVSSVMTSSGKSLFYKDRVTIERQLGLWQANQLSVLLTRLLSSERELKAPARVGADAVNHELYGIAQRRAAGGG